MATQYKRFPFKNWQIRGSYSVGLSTGLIAAGAGANAPIASFRWGNTSGAVAVVRKVILSAAVNGTAFSAGVASFNLTAARAFTASDSGGTAATLTTNNGKRSTNDPTTLLTDFRVANTGAVSAGTRTLDAQGLVSVMGNPGTATTGQILPPTDLIALIESNDFPPVLKQNEGLIIQANVPATGVWSASVTFVWDEMVDYRG